MQLEIQLLLRLHGIPHVKDYLKLEVKEKGDLILLKYNTIEADWTKSALYDCRGIILDKADNSKVIFKYNNTVYIGAYVKNEKSHDECVLLLTALSLRKVSKITAIIKQL